MVEAESTSETSVNFYQTTRHNKPEDSHLQRLVASCQIQKRNTVLRTVKQSPLQYAQKVTQPEVECNVYYTS
jgi:hypothetical protein